MNVFSPAFFPEFYHFKFFKYMSTTLIPVIITTNYRGIFFGFIDPVQKHQKTLDVEKCRNVRYYNSEVNGFQGLSSNGPNKDCTISAMAGGPVVLHEVTSITQCSEAAAAKWELL